MFAAASNLTNLTSLFGKSSSLSAYTLHTPSPSPASSSSHLPSTAGAGAGAGSGVPPGSHPKSFNVGLWKVLPATHKTTGKDVSVWVFEKRVLDGVKMDSSGRSAGAAKDWVIEQLKKEATSLSRLRHPDILHMVEPLEDTRSELTFVTELVSTSLHNVLLSATGAGGRRSERDRHRPPGTEPTGEVDLDEVEIQKGTLQIAKGLGFLHQQARMVHLNLTPEAVLINAKGDWKLSGLNLTTPLTQPDGTPTKYTYPEVDHRLPPQVQWKLDYLAPEYALDSQLTPANDLYSLGCVLYAVHMGGRPPFANGNSMSSLRDHAEGSLVRRDWASGSRWERCSSELRDLLPRLLTRHPSNRLSLASLPSHSFFSSLAISTLNFLDPTTFASKPREEKATFLRGLVRVLPTFSERLRKGKVLPSLLEEMKDPYLVPFLLPNVFEISRGLSKEEFTAVLPKLQPLFALKDPPQNMLTLLEHLALFEEKTLPPIFRENVMPLIYNSLECEHMPVQEKVLKLVPHLCEILDYGTVQNVLLVKVAILFTRTRILAIKVQTLECFTAMVKTLDKATLTTKMVPLLAKIKTKEPAVMMATLAVHEAMGAKVDREAIATLVLPQLWAMSMGPLLNADQFGRFMAVIRSLGSRVESEHTQHLREVRRLEAQTSDFSNGMSNGLGNGMELGMNGGGSGEMDFEALVKGASRTPVPASNSASGLDPWDEGWADGGDDGLSQAFASTVSTNGSTTSFPSFSNPTSPQPLSQPAPQSRTASYTSPSAPSLAGRLKARPIPSTAFNTSAFDTLQPTSSSSTVTSTPPVLSPPGGFATLQPTSRPAGGQRTVSSSSTMGGANYNISLSPQAPVVSPSIQPISPQTTSTASWTSLQPSQPSRSAVPSFSSNISSFQPLQASNPIAPPQQYTTRPQPQSQPHSQPQPPVAPASAPAPMRPPPGFTSGLMTPSVAPKPAWNNSQTGKVDWGDFDPLK